jgi:hypothetical protein
VRLRQCGRYMYARLPLLLGESCGRLTTTLSFKGARVEGHDLLERHAGVTCTLLRLPTEVLLCVMEHLEPYDLCSVAQTCAVRVPYMTRHELTTATKAPVVGCATGPRASEQRRLHLASVLLRSWLRRRCRHDVEDQVHAVARASVEAIRPQKTYTAYAPPHRTPPHSHSSRGYRGRTAGYHAKPSRATIEGGALR